MAPNFCKSGMISTCRPDEDGKQVSCSRQKGCDHYLQATWSDGCMFNPFDDVCTCLAAQKEAGKGKDYAVSEQ